MKIDDALMRRRVRYSCVALVLLFPFTAKMPMAEAEPANAEQSSSTHRQAVASACEHAGNVFLLGQPVAVALPAEVDAAPNSWLVTDDRGNEVAHGDLADHLATSGEYTQPGQRVSVGQLGVGWYRVEWCDDDEKAVGWTTAAVLAPLAATPPSDSPIGVDAAISWFARDDVDRQAAFARLAALAGVSWIRDRLRWRDLQPSADQPALDRMHNTTYDTAAALQARAGLHVLQVFHDTPAWAVGADGRRGRFPDDLRHAYRLCQAMSCRFAGKVQAWEPWNEANVADFGAHSIDEICTFQKAAYLGFKSGNAEVTVCWNATAGVPTDRQTAGVLNNETWPYYDTFNIHTYDWPTSYQRLWGPVRAAAVGKPIWVTESDRGMAVAADSSTRDRTARNERLKAEFIAQSYALSLQAGAARHFHFILGAYGERDVRFGLLHRDLTPRPAYVALATVGRMLAGARCLGRYVVADEPDAFVVAFSAFPAGQRRDVLVAWAERPGDWDRRGERRIESPLPDSLEIEWSCDYLGRSLAAKVPHTLASAPTYVVLPAGEASRLELELPDRNRPPEKPPYKTTPSPVVLQCRLPENTLVRDESIRWAWEYEHRLPAEAEHELPLFVYNFSDQEVAGTIRLERSLTSYQITPGRWQVTLAPQERRRLPARVRIAAPDDAVPKAENWLVFRGDFGDAGRPVLALQLFSQPK